MGLATLLPQIIAKRDKGYYIKGGTTSENDDEKYSVLCFVSLHG